MKLSISMLGWSVAFCLFVTLIVLLSLQTLHSSQFKSNLHQTSHTGRHWFRKALISFGGTRSTVNQNISES